MELGPGWQVAGAAVVWRRKSSYLVRDWEGSSRRSGAHWVGGGRAHQVREVEVVVCRRQREWQVKFRGVEPRSQELFRELISTE